VNLSLILELALSAYPDRVAVSCTGRGMTYADIDRLARGVAARLIADDRRAVVHVSPSSPALPVSVFAAARAGVPFVPLNYRLSADRRDALIAAHPDSLVVTDADDLEAWAGDPADAPDAPADEDLPALLLYTSGTTAVPKAAVLRHRHLMAYLFGTVEFGAAAEDEAALVTVPPYHVAGVTNLVSNLYAGRRVVYLDAFDPQTWLETVRSEGITQAMVVPTMLARLVEHLDGAAIADTPSLRSIAYGGARMPLPVLRRALELFPQTGFVNAYGLTETSSTIAVLGPDEHREAVSSDDEAVRARLGSVGRVVPGVELQVRDEDDAVLASGTSGLLFLRGEQVSGEYVGSSGVDTDGWFATRDRGWVDPDGYLFIEGRADDTIIRGGENIAPAEIEDVLAEHPAVIDAAVIGVPDDEWGQRIAAVVVLAAGADAGADDLREWVRARLRSSKTPDLVTFRAELPRTDTGKLLRRDLLAELVP
jgi:acyl-CoA synthetase (AMP-forming)/AMP-acid ligase II